MKLTELEPHWLVSPYLQDGVEKIPGFTDMGQPERQGMGMSFFCPLHRDHRLAISFANPVDGGPADSRSQCLWHRDGQTWEAITISPSVDAHTHVGCWHGFIRNGEIA